MKSEKGKKSLILMNIIIILILMIFLFRWNQSVNCKITTQDIYHSMVRIQDGNYYGNGSILSKEDHTLIIITTKHLLENNDQPIVTFYNGETVSADILYVSETHDIGFIVVSTNNILEDTLASICCIQYNQRTYQKLKQDDTMQYGVLNEDNSFAMKKGTVGNPSWYVEEFNDYMIYNYCEAIPGMSGCGTFDQNGNYIGMLIGGLYNESASLPMPVIMQIYNEYVS